MATTRLTRSATDSMIGGVCGGLARYFGIDSTIVRLVFVLAVLSGLSPLIYIVLWIIMPKEELSLPTPPAQDPTGEWKYDPYTGQRIR
ncbi:PspC domain-containing protein [Chloroflexus sp.]|uniref:PspC domain-containing protein n=1 Tax=Chloroflexus sp. TaxID=1904827 RepID=UPI00298F02C8|nr:PspC domain-containing protein [Chloroflexus sp.]MCS6886640.1 PspC domain-containing protein [Chloroflexus sp.]MDW8403460.1 PspC domain-containing protein [Chloroflexus sp.]